MKTFLRPADFSISKTTQQEIENEVRTRIGVEGRISGVFHWPFDESEDFADGPPDYVVKYKVGEDGIEVTITDFEAALENYEETRRERIARANEY
jgi:hypothetical protein